MSLKTIGEVAREFGVSTRMLRYYDETGFCPASARMLPPTACMMRRL